MAYLALFVALGGTSYAAIRLPANSVGTREIKTRGVGASELRARSVGTSELKPGAITNTQVKPGSLRASAFASGELPGGPVQMEVTSAPSQPLPQQPDVRIGRATCPAGMVATGGGWTGLSDGAQVIASAPGQEADGANPTGWTVAVRGGDATVSVVCARLR